MKILCIGSSNTYGYDPRSYIGSRYPKEVRWTGRLDLCERIRHEFEIHPIEDEKGLEVVGAIYHVEDGRVEFLDD